MELTCSQLKKLKILKRRQCSLASANQVRVYDHMIASSSQLLLFSFFLGWWLSHKRKWKCKRKNILT